jgi:predicted transcriptional regulator
MTQANLNFGLLEKYLDKVIKLHLVKTQDKYYTLTTLGQDFLRQYDRYYKRYVSAQELLAILDHEYQQLDTLISAS